LCSGEDNQVFRSEGNEDDSQSWESKFTYLVAILGSAVGFENVWQFPKLAQKCGGVLCQKHN